MERHLIETLVLPGVSNFRSFTRKQGKKGKIYCSYSTDWAALGQSTLQRQNLYRYRGEFLGAIDRITCRKPVLSQKSTLVGRRACFIKVPIPVCLLLIFDSLDASITIFFYKDCHFTIYFQRKSRYSYLFPQLPL